MDRDRRGPRGRRLWTAVLAFGMALGAPAARAAGEDTAAPLKALAERLQQLEQRNAELERQLNALQQAAAAPAAVPAAVEVLPESAEVLEAGDGEGPRVEAGVVVVAQQVNAAGSEDGMRRSRLGYRGDLAVALPAGSLGEAQSIAFAHVRFGQGPGVSLRPTYTGAVNSAGFETSAGPDDSFAILAQAWYQFEWSLGRDGFNGQKGRRLELTVGKMDLFGFFDQNAVAADEATQFLNNVFVHNPLLDSGADIAADAYGFAPGLRLGVLDGNDRWSWGASLGVFGAGDGANFSGGLGKPLVIVQFEVSPMQINGEPRGSYRLYTWTNGRTTDLDDQQQRHTGLGLSVDQRIGRDWHLFGRWGRRTGGDGAFDDALTLGFELGGRAWGRGNDAIGLAAGSLRTASAWRAATADGSRVGYAAIGSERIAELYYRMKLNEHLDVSPDLQWIRRAGGDGLAPTARVVGLRASLGF